MAFSTIYKADLQYQQNDTIGNIMVEVFFLRLPP